MFSVLCGRIGASMCLAFALGARPPLGAGQHRGGGRAPRAQAKQMLAPIRPQSTENIQHALVLFCYGFLSCYGPNDPTNDLASHSFRVIRVAEAEKCTMTTIFSFQAAVALA